MASTVENEMQSLVEVLDTILAPLGKAKKRILDWVEREIETHAIVQYVYELGPPLGTIKNDKGETEEIGGPQIWQLGQPSPVDRSEIVFAMFFWDTTGIVAAFSFKQVEIEGGGTATSFFRSLIFKPIHVHGPVHHDALTNELGAFLDEEGQTDPEPGGDAPANGARASA